MPRPGFLFCISPDSSLIKEQVERLAAEFPPGHAVNNGGMLEFSALGAQAPGWTRKVFWGDSNLDNDFWECLGMQNLFGSGTLILLRNAQALPAEIWKKLSIALGQANPAVWVILCLEVEFERGKPKIPAHISRLKAYEFARKQSWIWQNPGLDKAGVMQDYIREQAGKIGLKIPPLLLPELAELLPPDATAVKLELEKLNLLMHNESGESELKREHLALIGERAGADIYQVLRALQNNQNLTTVWAMVLASETGSANDRMLFGFLGALVREARILWQLLFSENVYVPPGALNEKKALARKLGVRKLAELWELALEAEKGVKSGEVSEEQALEYLMAELSLLFAK